MSHKLAKRNAEIERYIAAGHTLSQTASRFGMTRQRVAQIVGSTPRVPSAVVNTAIEEAGVDRARLAREYAARYGVAYSTARTKLSEVRWRPSMRFTTADRVLTLLDRTELLHQIGATP